MLQVAKEVRRLRLAHGFLLKDVARLSFVSVSSVMNIEHGRQWPPMTVLRRIVGLYGVGLAEFFYKVDKPR